jgi:uncharacterized protein (DUF433 family)
MLAGMLEVDILNIIRIAFGRPVIAGTRIPTAEVAERFNAGDLNMDIAADYECPASQIEEAIRWERAA